MNQFPLQRLYELLARQSFLIPILFGALLFELGITGVGAWYARSDPWLFAITLTNGLTVAVLLTVIVFAWDSGRKKRRKLKRTRESLEAAERFGQSSLDALSTHIAILDANGVIVAVNNVWTQFGLANFGGVAAPGIGTNYLATCDTACGENSAEAQPVADGIREVMRGERDSFTIEYPCHSAREQRWFVLRVTRFAGRGPLFLVVAHENITLRKEQELAVGRLNLSLRAATEGAGVGIWEWDGTTGALTWNQAMYRLYGLDPASSLTAKEVWINARHPDDRARINEEMDLALRDEKALDTQFRVIWPNGQVRWLRTKARLLFDTDSRALSLIGTNWDISDYKAAEADLIAAKKEADHANEAKSQFLASMSHELRTPMNAVLGFAQLMTMDESLSQDHQEDLQQILKSGKYLLDLINDVLNLAKIETGGAEPEVESFTSAELIDECLSLITPLAESAGIQVEPADVGVDWLMTDRRMLKQVLINLLGNAVKYNQPGGRINLKLERLPDSSVRLSVYDTGFGIPKERLAELFQPFNRLGAELSQIEGTGIGLAVCQRLVTKLGGRIEVGSELGVGSVFHVCLAAGADKSGEPAECPVEALAHATAAVEFKGTVLHIEANPADRLLLRKVLAGHSTLKIIDATNAESGIELAAAYQPDVIFIDIRLPGMDGYAALKLLRAHDSTRDIRVIAVSANALPEDIAHAQAAGFNNCLIKPYSHAALMAVFGSGEDFK